MFSEPVDWKRTKIMVNYFSQISGLHV